MTFNPENLVLKLAFQLIETLHARIEGLFFSLGAYIK